MSKRRALLLVLGVVAFLLAGASMPHTHAGATPGLWNADHDLSLMAAFGTHACQLDATPALGFVPLLMAIVALAAIQVVSAPQSLSDPRAPPSF